MTVGMKIRIARKRKGITQNELASLTGLTRNTIVQYEKDSFEPSYNSIKLINEALDVDIYNPTNNEPIDIDDIVYKSLLENALKHKYGNVVDEKKLQVIKDVIDIYIND